MEFQNLIKASSMIRNVLGNMSQDIAAEGEMEENIEKLKADLRKFENLIEE